MYNAILANVDLLKLRNTELTLVFTASFHPAYQDLLLKHIPSLFSGVGWFAGGGSGLVVLAGELQRRREAPGEVKFTMFVETT